MDDDALRTVADWHEIRREFHPNLWKATVYKVRVEHPTKGLNGSRIAVRPRVHVLKMSDDRHWAYNGGFGGLAPAVEYGVLPYMIFDTCDEFEEWAKMVWRIAPVYDIQALSKEVDGGVSI